MFEYFNINIDISTLCCVQSSLTCILPSIADDICHSLVREFTQPLVMLLTDWLQPPLLSQSTSNDDRHSDFYRRDTAVEKNIPVIKPHTFLDVQDVSRRPFSRQSSTAALYFCTIVKCRKMCRLGNRLGRRVGKNRCLPSLLNTLRNL